MNLLKIYSIIIFVGMLSACGGGKDDVEPEINDPEMASLVFPEADSECTEGTSATATESTITFKWNAAKFADQYQLALKNLKSGASRSYSSTATTLAIKLDRGTPYAWSVISKSNTSKVTATSDTWKFYNASSGNSSYTPFPAEAISPVNNCTVTSNTITLNWQGSDVDDDISHYTVYFGETNPPELHQDNVTGSSVEDIPITKNKTYYWRIDTKDDQENSSSSDIFKFTVK